MQRSFVFSLVFLGTLALAAEVPTYSHFVRPDGSPTSSCSQAEPCTLARAFALAATPGMPCGSVVQVAAGYYVQAELVYGPSKTCSAGHVRQAHWRRPGAVVTGLETKPSAARVPSRPAARPIPTKSRGTKPTRASSRLASWPSASRPPG